LSVGFPQGLKPGIWSNSNGTAEAVPFHGSSSFFLRGFTQISTGQALAMFFF
jgi:hypothetical protein